MSHKGNLTLFYFLAALVVAGMTRLIVWIRQRKLKTQAKWITPWRQISTTGSPYRGEMKAPHVPHATGAAVIAAWQAAGLSPVATRNGCSILAKDAGERVTMLFAHSTSVVVETMAIEKAAKAPAFDVALALLPLFGPMTVELQFIFGSHIFVVDGSAASGELQRQCQQISLQEIAAFQEKLATFNWGGFTSNASKSK